jgi:hypothetical protein
MRGWNQVNLAHADLVAHWATFRWTRRALHTLPDSGRTLEKFKEIHKTDLKTIADVINPERVGQRNDLLPWFWTMHQDSSDPAWLDKGIYFLLSDLSLLIVGYTVNRVNWLRAKNRADRWIEEETIVHKEMAWTLLGLQHLRDDWTAQKQFQQEMPGLTAYAAKQEAMWNDMLTTASSAFSPLLQEM